jgi:hypothetical protein
MTQMERNFAIGSLWEFVNHCFGKRCHKDQADLVEVCRRDARPVSKVRCGYAAVTIGGWLGQQDER